MRCRQVRDLIAGYREGWLSDRQARAVEEHLGRCAACAEEARRDAALTRALAVPNAPREAPALVLPMALPRRRPARYGLALGSAAAAAALLLLIAGPLQNGSLHSGETDLGTPMLAMEQPDFGMAHAWLSAGDPGGDPNRAVLSGLATRAD
jgi:anti-sigma factor RsiW